MAQLKSTNINGNLAVTGEVVAPNIDATNLKVENIQHPEETGMVQLGKVSLGGDASSSGSCLLQKDVKTGTIETGPAFGTSTTQFLRNDGTWAEPLSVSGDSNGNVTVTKDLTVKGIGYFSNDIEVAGTINANDITANDYITLKSGYPIRFYSEDNTKFVDIQCNDEGELTSNGDLSTKNIYPTATNTSNLGSSSKQYNTIYGKTIYENGTSLSSKYASKTEASTSAAGLMSATDKSKLDNVVSSPITKVEYNASAAELTLYL